MKELIPLELYSFDGVDPPSERPKVTWIDVNGREEHEAMLRNPAKMKELGLDQIFEIMVYLERWGGWLKDEP